MLIHGEYYSERPVLRVRNLAQAIHMTEIDGQLSDGNWENARPENHWRPWCDAIVVVDPENVGRNFYARKTSYRLNDKDLLDVVGPRMLAECYAAGLVDYTRADLVRDLIDLRKIFKTDSPRGLDAPDAPTYEERRWEQRPKLNGGARGWQDSWEAAEAFRLECVAARDLRLGEPWAEALDADFRAMALAV